MSSAAVSSHSGSGGSLSLMSCVRESSPFQDYECDTEKIVASKKKFWNPKKWFKRKNKVMSDDGAAAAVVEIHNNESSITNNCTTNKEISLRSRSTSELSVDEENTRRRSTSSSMHQGLSQSHDSVFHSPNSGSSDIGLDAGRSTSSLSISQPHIDRVQTELNERLRLRRGRGDTNSEDDEGLPHSPCNSPTTTDGGGGGGGGHHDKTAIKDLPAKSHSTCSDGSLLSMDSCEMDEDSFGLHSRHSSRLSLHEKKTSESELDLELDYSPSSSSSSSSLAPLNHSAAHHRVAVKPKRTHGAPRRRRGVPQMSSALPVTIEVNEETSRSLTPENTINKEIIIEHQTSNIKLINEYTIKCSSLPSGLTTTTTTTNNDENNKLNRSKSNTDNNNKSSFDDHFDILYEEKEDNNNKSTSFFERIFPRKSAKKNNNKRTKDRNDDNDINSPPIKMMLSIEQQQQQQQQKPIVIPRSSYCGGPASRQRIQPIDIPPSPEDNRKSLLSPIIKSSPNDNKGFLSQSPPFHAELETRFKQQQQIRSNFNIISTSPPKSLPPLTTTPPISPKSNHNNTDAVINEQISSLNVIKNNDFKHKIKLTGLSTLQQRVISMNDDDNIDGYKSLTDLPLLETKPTTITKSHSFKSYSKNTTTTTTTTESINQIHTTNNKHLNEKDNNNMEKVRAASLDSIKNLETNVKFEMKKLHKNNDDFGITISGPSHTAIVNITTNQQHESTTNNTFIAKNETETPISSSQISITKIQMKRETTNQIPEFLNKQLNKVETKPLSNIIFSTTTNNTSPPRIIEEQTRPKIQFESIPRKFSQDNLEIIEKTYNNEDELLLLNNNKNITTRFKKNEKNSIRKSSMISITPETPKKQFIKNRSMSLDSLKSDIINTTTITTNNESIKSSQDSLNEKPSSDETTTTTTVVVLRRKSIIMQNNNNNNNNNEKNDDEPELMKVFARRSLKLKDIECEQVTERIDTMLEENYINKVAKDNNSDKENQLENDINIQQDEQKSKKSTTTQEQRRKSFTRPEETKITEITKNFSKESSHTIENDIQLKKTVNNNIFSYQRAIKRDNSIKIEQQQQRKSNNWIKSEQSIEIKDEILPPSADIIDTTTTTTTDDILTKPKNFNQRKAEWEKRAQQAAQKKNVP